MASEPAVVMLYLIYATVGKKFMMTARRIKQTNKQTNKNTKTKQKTSFEAAVIGLSHFNRWLQMTAQTDTSHRSFGFSLGCAFLSFL